MNFYKEANFCFDWGEGGGVGGVGGGGGGGEVGGSWYMLQLLRDRERAQESWKNFYNNMILTQGV